MNLKILPYRAGSASCRELSLNLGVKRLKLLNSRWIANDNTLILNWGNTKPEIRLIDSLVINKPAAVLRASNKRTFFQAISKMYTVPWTTDIEIATDWLNDNKTVVVRKKLSGHSGEGIEIVSKYTEDNEETVLPEAPLYTMYVKKKSEYRVHVFAGEVIDIQRKMRRTDVPDEEVNWQIRNHSNGFIYGREDAHLPIMVQYRCIKCVEICGLDFGAVDVIYNEKSGRYYILEVNTAPGLTGTTLEKYSDKIREVMNDDEFRPR